ncbi:hypothetical protein Lal_00013926 [Lupinus albus]|nr:hypothetical protein Lal_00013926 [Lupinus albus]
MRAFQEQGALGLILELEKRVNMDDKVEDVNNESHMHVRMTERGRETSQNTSDDLLAQMLEVLQGMNENLRNLNRSVAPGPGSLSQAGSET